MSKSSPQPDVLVLGDHPCAYFAAALLRQNASIRVSHCLIPDEQIGDRLVTLNPDFFELNPLLAGLKRQLDLVPIYGLRFLADDPATESLHTAKSISAYVGGLKQLHSALLQQAHESQVNFHHPASLEICQLDENGVDLLLDDVPVHARLLIVAGELTPDQKRMIGLPPAWDPDVLHRYSFLRLKSAKWYDAAGKDVIPMSLDLRGTLNWGWLLPGPGQIQIAVDQPAASVADLPPSDLLKHWIDVLLAHGVLKATANVAALDLDAAVSLELPLAGALSQEGVANRTLLIGPAGGFYTACAEDIYPACWSALHAADVAKKALQERHLQDALQPYRQRWGATLGDYLRGPQQNLRFLLPLVYRNSTMTARLTEAILLGKSVVR